MKGVGSAWVASSASQAAASMAVGSVWMERCKRLTEGGKTLDYPPFAAIMSFG